MRGTRGQDGTPAPALPAPTAPALPAPALPFGRFAAVVPVLTARQRQALAVFRTTQSMRRTAEILRLSESRAYAIFAQVARKLDVAPGVLRDALRGGELSLVPVSEPVADNRSRDQPRPSDAVPASTLVRTTR